MSSWRLVLASTALMLFLTACNQNRNEQSAVTGQEASSEAVETHSGQQANEAAHEMEGIAIALTPTQGNSATGTVMLMPMGDGVHFSGIVSGLTPGQHALHVHEKGDCSAPDGTSAGGHFNPTAVDHGAPDAAVHHAGDLGNIIANADGRAEINIHANGVALEPGANSIRGRALIVHAAADDFKTQPTGNAGGRVACGVIEAAN